MIQNPKLRAIATEAANKLVALVQEAEEKILEAWDATETEAQEQGTENPKFKMGLGITLDLGNDKMTTDLTFGVRHKLSADQSIPDPSQPSLPLEGARVTIKQGEEVLYDTDGDRLNTEVARAAKKIHDLARKHGATVELKQS